MLLWTNPPDPDLASIRFYASHEIEGRADTLAVGPFPGVGDTLEVGEYRIVAPGASDSVRFQLPCTSTPVGWSLWNTAADTAGNESGTSNVAPWTEGP